MKCECESCREARYWVIALVMLALLFISGCGGTPPITFATLNLANGYPTHEYNTPAVRTKQRALIASVSPAFVAMEEVDVNCERSQRADTAVEAASALSPGIIRFIRAYRDDTGCEQGNAVYVSPDFDATFEEMQLPVPPNDWPRVALVVNLRHRATGIATKVVATHLTAGNQSAFRSYQLQGIVDAHPDVIIGDLNALHAEAAPLLPGYMQVTPELTPYDVDAVYSLLPATGEAIPTDGASDHDHMMVARSTEF